MAIKDTRSNSLTSSSNKDTVVDGTDNLFDSENEKNFEEIHHADQNGLKISGDSNSKEDSPSRTEKKEEEKTLPSNKYVHAQEEGRGYTTFCWLHIIIFGKLRNSKIRI